MISTTITCSRCGHSQKCLLHKLRVYQFAEEPKLSSGCSQFEVIKNVTTSLLFFLFQTENHTYIQTAVHSSALDCLLVTQPPHGVRALLVLVYLVTTSPMLFCILIQNITNPILTKYFNSCKLCYFIIILSHII